MKVAGGNPCPLPLNDSPETFKKLFILAVQVFQRCVRKKKSDLSVELDTFVMSKGVTCLSQQYMYMYSCSYLMA